MGGRGERENLIFSVFWSFWKWYKSRVGVGWSIIYLLDFVLICSNLKNNDELPILHLFGWFDRSCALVRDFSCETWWKTYFPNFQRLPSSPKLPNTSTILPSTTTIPNQTILSSEFFKRTKSDFLNYILIICRHPIATHKNQTLTQ